MLARFFHAWERRLASVTKDRQVRPFEWGIDWIEPNGHSPLTPSETVLRDWVSAALTDTPKFFDTPETSDYSCQATSDGCELRFPSAIVTPHPENNTVHAIYFRSGPTTRGQRAVVVLPQWNAGA